MSGDGVVWRDLGSIASITTGTKPPTLLSESQAPIAYLNGGVKPSGWVESPNTNGDTIAIPSRGSVGYVGYSFDPFWCGPLCYRITSETSAVITRFLYHFLKSREPQIVALQQTGSIPALNKKELAKFRVPLAPLEAQVEITRILDQFTWLEAELEAELRARRVQYSHYRSELLQLAGLPDVQLSTLGEVSLTVTSGGTPPTGRPDYYGGDIPWLRTQEVDFGTVRSTSATITEAGLRNSSAKWIPENCVIVAMYGATAAKVAVNEIPLTTNQACCNLQIDPAVADFRYVFHWVSNEYERLRSLGEGSQSNINAQKVKDYPILLPSLAKQAAIVEILDKFDALVNDLSIGLPAELAARRKQYEYYRDKLLTFEEAPA